MNLFRWCVFSAFFLFAQFGAYAQDLSSTQISQAWTSVVNAIAAADLNATNKAIDQLDRAKVLSGYEALEDYSLYLVAQAQRSLEKKDFDSADFYTKKAIALSPTSPRILVRTLPLVNALNLDLLHHIYKIAIYSLINPNLILVLVSSLIYPSLWALTIGLYLSVLIYFCFNFKGLSQELARHMSSGVRGLCAPFVCLLVLIIPCAFGPIYSLATWSVCIFIFCKKDRLFGFIAGVIICLWGLLIPIRESLNIWLKQEGIQVMLNVSSGYVQAMLNVASGYYSNVDRVELEDLLLKRKDDGVVYYSYGQLLRRTGDLKLSEEAFIKAEMLLGQQPWTKAQRAIVAFLQGDLQKSDQLFAEAQNLGIKSAEFYFDYSKVKFELLDTTGSQALFKKASQIDPELARVFRDRENAFGIRSNHALAEIRLPIRKIIISALKPIEGSYDQQIKLSNIIAPLLSPPKLSILGLILIIAYFFIDPSHKSKRKIVYFDNFKRSGLIVAALRVFPGGAWIVSGQILAGFTIITLITLFSLPLLSWPGDLSIILQFKDSFYDYYLYAYLSIVAVLTTFGARLELSK